MRAHLARLAHSLYVHAPGTYRSLYRGYKAWSDKAERQLLRAQLAPGMVVVDVGANIGVYSAFLARLVGANGTVHAFEPDLRNFRWLGEATRDFPAIKLLQAAVGEKSGTILLHTSTDLNVDHHTYDDGSGRPTREVALVSLDEHFAPGTRIDFIKLDIQGYEMHALRGMRRVLAENRHIQLLLEFWPYGLRRADVRPESLVDFLQDLGFRLANIPPGSSLRLPTRDGVDDYVNLHAFR